MDNRNVTRNTMTSSNGNIFRILAIWAWNSPVPGEFLAQRPVTRSFDVFFDLRLNKRLSKQSSGWWFETLPCPLWRHCNCFCVFIHGKLDCLSKNWPIMRQIQRWLGTYRHKGPSNAANYPDHSLLSHKDALWMPLHRHYSVYTTSK